MLFLTYKKGDITMNKRQAKKFRKKQRERRLNKYRILMANTNEAFEKTSKEMKRLANHFHKGCEHSAEIIRGIMKNVDNAMTSLLSKGSLLSKTNEKIEIINRINENLYTKEETDSDE